MIAVVQAWFGRFTLLRTFSVLSALILVMIAILLANRLQNVLDRFALQQETVQAIGETQILVHAGLLPQGTEHGLTPDVISRLAAYAHRNMAYGGDVRVKIWGRDGTILYSDSPAAHGMHFPIDGDLAMVLNGEAPSAADISDLSAAENSTERGQFTHLLEVYVPIPGGPSAPHGIGGAYEAYHDLSLLDAQDAMVRRDVWISVAAGFFLLYISLFLVVRSASRRLVRHEQDNARLLDEAQRREADATLLYRAGERLRTGIDRDGVMQGVLDAVCSAFSYLNCSVLLYDREREVLVPHIHAGMLNATVLEQPISLGKGLIGQAAQLRRTINVPDVRSEPRYLPGHSDTAAEIVLPLLAGNDLIGVLNVESAQRYAFGERDLKVLSVLANQAAMAIQNSNLFAQREAAYLATLDAMARTIDARDPYTAGHSQRVAEYAEAIGRKMGASEETAVMLKRAGQLHDIGKIGVADAILRKPGSLDGEERAAMQQHAALGHSLLRDMSFLGDALGVVRHHHERWDGGGYPDGLAGEAIPLGARIMGVADAFDTMTSDRPYRRALPLSVARARLLEGAHTQFWLPAVEALVSLLDAGLLPTYSTLQEEPAPAGAA